MNPDPARVRQIRRVALPDQLADYLAGKQVEVDQGGEVEVLWASARKTKRFASICKVLGTMAGPRQRCMYCSDSRATDVDHYYPKSQYPDKVFSWMNFIWTCAGCNRKKGTHFQLDRGEPLLLDPTAGDPWNHLFFDDKTGLLAPAYVDGVADARGRYTLDLISAINSEAVAEGRRRAHRAIRGAVEIVVEKREALASGDTLRSVVADHDEYGLAAFLFGPNGRDREPFRSLAQMMPGLCDELSGGR